MRTRATFSSGSPSLEIATLREAVFALHDASLIEKRKPYARLGVRRKTVSIDKRSFVRPPLSDPRLGAGVGGDPDWRYFRLAAQASASPGRRQIRAVHGLCAMRSPQNSIGPISALYSSR